MKGQRALHGEATVSSTDRPTRPGAWPRYRARAGRPPEAGPFCRAASASLFIVLLACGEAVEGSRAPAPDVWAVPPGQRFSGRLLVDLVSEPPSEIRYTLDGSSPNGAAAPRFVAPLAIERNTYLSFVAVSPDGQWSDLRIELYVLEEPPPPFVPPARALELSQDHLFFSAGPEDVVLERSLELRSVGLDPVRVHSVRLAPGGAYFEDGIFEIGTPPDALEGLLFPGQTRTLTLRYRVTETLRTALLVLATDDLRAPDGAWEVTIGGRRASW